MAKINLDPSVQHSIINIALDYFSENRCIEIPINLLVEKSGYSRENIFNCFKDEEDIIFQSFQVFFDYFFHNLSILYSPEMSIFKYLDYVIDFLLKFFENSRFEQEKKGLIDINRDKQAKLFIHFYSISLTNHEYRRSLQLLYSNYLNFLSERIFFEFKNKEKTCVDSKKIAYEVFSYLKGIFLSNILGINFFDIIELKDRCNCSIRKIIDIN